MKKLVFAFSIVGVLSGCGTTQVSGTGDFFALTSRNVVYRDLTRPVSVDNEPEVTNYVVLSNSTK